jgi:hypothetical protein
LDTYNTKIEAVSNFSSWSEVQSMMTSNVLPFAMVLALLSFIVLSQGLIAAIMVYQHHIGIDGETR